MNDFLSNLFSLKRKTAIVTGCSRGIGSEIAVAYKKAGANVVCIARSMSPNEEFLQDSYLQCDVNDTANFQAICTEVVNKYESLDILVNAAGITLPSENGVEESERFSKTLAVNLVAPYMISDIASKFMKNGGSIINITSIGSLLGFPDNPGYVASKAGLRVLSKAMALDLGNKNIRVNNIVPGYIKTDMTLKSYSSEKLYEKRLDRMILKRWGSVDDVIGAAIFLASDASSYITGSDLVIDGGWTAKGL